MFEYNLISIVLYLLIYFGTKKHVMKVKNYLNAVGIVWANIAFYVMIAENDIMWFLHLAIAIYLCIMLDRTSNKILQYNIESGETVVSKEPSKGVVAVLAIFLGIIGAHNFYLNKKTKGALYLMFAIFMIPMYIGIIEGIMYLIMPNEQFKTRYAVQCVVKRRKENVSAELKEKPKKVSKESYTKATKLSDQVGMASIKVEKVFREEQEKSRVQKINIPIGTAEIDKVGKEMKIKITDTNGKVYEFETVGNMQLFATFKASGMQTAKEYGGK